MMPVSIHTRIANRIAEKHLRRVLHYLFSDTLEMHFASVTDVRQSELWELVMTFPNGTETLEAFNASMQSLLAMEKQLVKWRGLSDKTQLPNKRAILQMILDEIEPGWWIKKPSPTDPKDIEQLCVFQKETMEAHVEIPNNLFQEYEPAKIKELARAAIRHAGVRE